MDKLVKIIGVQFEKFIKRSIFLGQNPEELRISQI